MTFTEAAMPTLSGLHRHLASSVKSVPSVAKQPAPDLRKYVIFANAAGIEHAVVFPRTLLHIDIELAQDCAGQDRYVAISAGTYGVINGLVVITGVGSTTLDLDSRPQDSALIQQLLSESV